MVATVHVKRAIILSDPTPYVRRNVFTCGPAEREEDETYGSHGHVAVRARDAHDVSFWTIKR